MHGITRSYLAVALSLLLVLTGQSMASARAMTTPTGEMVLCTGTGPVTVYMDEDGQPTRPPYVCPDCLMHLVVAVLPPVLTLGPAPRSFGPSLLRTEPALAVKAIHRATARGPPA